MAPIEPEMAPKLAMLLGTWSTMRSKSWTLALSAWLATPSEEPRRLAASPATLVALRVVLDARLGDGWRQTEPPKGAQLGRQGRPRSGRGNARCECAKNYRTLTLTTRPIFQNCSHKYYEPKRLRIMGKRRSRS